MDKFLKIGKAYYDQAEYGFLQHITHEILLGTKVIGHASVTLYNFREAANQNTAWKWISSSGSYLSNYKEYLFDDSSTQPKLPSVVEEEITNTNTVAIVDEINLFSEYQGKRLESYILSDLMELYLQESEVLLLGGFMELADKMGYDKDLSTLMYCQLGFVFIDDFVAMKFKSISTDNLDDIDELHVAIEQFY